MTPAEPDTTGAEVVAEPGVAGTETALEARG